MSKPIQVSLIRPPLIRPRSHLTALETFPPLHLAYLNGALHAAGIESRILDAQASHQVTPIPGDTRCIVGLTIPEILAALPEDIDAIGVNCMYTHTWFYDAQLLRALRARFPEKPIIIGGEHASATARELLEACPEIDAVVVGEGERVLPRLIERLLQQQSLDDLPGVAHRQPPAHLGAPLPKERILKMEILPRPSWEGVDLDFYLSRGAGITQKSKRTMPIIASRGCPHSCSFCTVSTMWNSRWTHRPADDVVQEMKDYYEKMGITHFDFIDLTLTTSRAWVEAFCASLERAALPVTWALPIGTRAEALDAPLIRRMRSTGLTHIMFSAESASPATLRAIRKRLDVGHLAHCLRASVNEGLIVKLVFVSGFPGQRWRDVFWNLAYAIRAALWGVHDIVSLGFVPYPGSQLYEQLRQSGRIGAGFDYITLNNDLAGMVSWSDFISSRSLRAICFLTMAVFYGVQFLTHPGRLARSARNLFLGRAPWNNFELLLFSRIRAWRA